jgi:bacteriocin-like protein
MKKKNVKKLSKKDLKKIKGGAAGFFRRRPQVMTVTKTDGSTETR